MSEIRDRLRSALFGIKPRSMVIEVAGEKLELRQPPVSAVLDTAQSADGDDKKVGIAKMVMQYCYVPGTDERVFEDADIDAMMQMPFGEEWKALQEAIDKLTNFSKTASEVGKP